VAASGLVVDVVENGVVIAVLVLLYAEVIAAPTDANWLFTPLAVSVQDCPREFAELPSSCCVGHMEGRTPGFETHPKALMPSSTIAPIAWQVGCLCRRRLTMRIHPSRHSNDGKANEARSLHSLQSILFLLGICPDGA
jgi:hypothetical protein